MQLPASALAGRARVDFGETADHHGLNFPQFPHGFNAVSRIDTPSIVRSYDDAPCTAVDLVRIPLATALHARNGKLCAFKFAPCTVVHRISGQSEYHRPGLQSCRRLNLIPLSASVVAQIRLFQVSTQVGSC